MDTRIQVGEKVRIMYDEPKWECGEWYGRKEDGEIIEIHKDYFIVKTDSGLEVEYDNNTLNEKTRYGYGLIYFSTPTNIHLENINCRLDKIENDINDMKKQQNNLHDVDYSSAKNAPLMYGNTIIGIVKNYDKKGFIDCVLWDRFTDIGIESNGRNIHTFTVHGGNISANE